MTCSTEVLKGITETLLEKKKTITWMLREKRLK